MSGKDWNGFRGTAKRLEDVDIPRIAHRINVGEDELHAFMDTEAAGSGFDRQRRPKALYEPHIAYRISTGETRKRLVAAGLAYPKWGEKPYPADSYTRIEEAMAIDETIALRATSWGLTQILGDNFTMIGFSSPQALVRAFMEDEEHHLDAAVTFIIASGIDDEMRALAALDRKTLASDCVGIVAVYNGPGYKKNGYHTKFAAAHNKWRKIKDTAWSPGTTYGDIAGPAHPMEQPSEDVIRNLQQRLRDLGYPEIGNVDGKFGDRTETAILAFRKNQGLPLATTIDGDLLSALMTAKPREMSAERTTATASDLKTEPAVAVADKLRNSAIAITGLGTVGGLVDGFDVTGWLDRVKKVNSAAEAVMSISPWVLLVGGGALTIWLASRFIQEQVKAYREGRHV